ncbi:MAG: hypothetical protein Q4G26_10100 [Paracoccus sp. (in: a-proteobacteria)]|nr:hypothetical protein [Paracoccus sp. (in: a-proteobacteria)]
MVYRVKRILIPVVLALIAGVTFMVNSAQSRPTSLGLSLSAHPLAPSAKKLWINGSVEISETFGDRSQGGGIPYKNSFNDRLEFEVVWHDIISGQAYRADFALSASEMPTFGGKGKHTVLNVKLGPGADFTVTTSSRELLLYLGLKQDDKITAAMRAPVILLEGCGTPITLTDERLVSMVAGMSEADGVYSMAMEDRESAISAGITVTSRCKVN